MPIYEYRCEECGSHFEVIQKVSDRPLKTCSNCNGRLTKLISQTSFQLKGSGWYVTDYAKSGKSKEKTESGTATETGPETKKKEASSKEKTSKETASKDTSSKKESSKN
jgi:putative FmdB family regulatory protein